VAPLLPFYDIDPVRVRILGTGLWDDPSLGKEPELVGGWYAAPDPKQRADFEQRYATLFGAKPPRIATLGYDATALAALLAKKPGGADFSAAALTNPNGFAGLDGIFRLRADGLNDRGLAVLEVQRDAPRIVSPAPVSFVTN
jgi:branched-chain amino acid transport system substrate-binding protein